MLRLSGYITLPVNTAAPKQRPVINPPSPTPPPSDSDSPSSYLAPCEDPFRESPKDSDNDLSEPLLLETKYSDKESHQVTPGDDTLLSQLNNFSKMQTENQNTDVFRQMGNTAQHLLGLLRTQAKQTLGRDPENYNLIAKDDVVTAYRALKDDIKHLSDLCDRHSPFRQHHQLISNKYHKESLAFHAKNLQKNMLNLNTLMTQTQQRVEKYNQQPKVTPHSIWQFFNPSENKTPMMKALNLFKYYDRRFSNRHHQDLAKILVDQLSTCLPAKDIRNDKLFPITDSQLQKAVNSLEEMKFLMISRGITQGSEFFKRVNVALDILNSEYKLDFSEKDSATIPQAKF